MKSVQMYLLPFTTLYPTSTFTAVNHLTTILKKSSDETGFNLTMRFEWKVVRDPDSTTAQKTVIGHTDIEVLSTTDPGELEVTRAYTLNFFAVNHNRLKYASCNCLFKL